MAYYGITDKSQLIDIRTIKEGCDQYIDALNYLLNAGKDVAQASKICTKEAMSVDGQSLEMTLYEMGKDFADVAKEYSGYANELYQQAVGVYNEQVAELNAYLQEQANKKAQQNANKGSN